MDITVLEQFISGVGAPMSMCVGLYYMLIKVSNKQMDTIRELEKAVNLNTIATQSLADILRGMNK